MNCNTCNRQLEVLEIEGVLGKAAGTIVRFSAIEFLGCKNGHLKKYAYPDFGSDLRRETFESGVIVFTRPRVFLRKEHLCGRCGTLVIAEDSKEMIFVAVLTLDKLKEIILEISTQGLKCEACGTLQVLGAKVNINSIANAIINAFENIGLS